MTADQTARAAKITEFLLQAGWVSAQRQAVTGDASHRRYERLTQSGATAILMDDPSNDPDAIRQFARVADHLRALGLSTPAILSMNAGHGLMLLEDLGDTLFAQDMTAAPACQTDLYRAATDVLIQLHQHPTPEWAPDFTPDYMAAQLDPLWQWYVGHGQPQPDQHASFSTLFQPKLRQYADDQTVLIHRDYHAENLIHLPDRHGVARVGIIDFQDAKSGAPAYDLVSLLQDARRDVPVEIEQAMITRYLTRTGQDRDVFLASYATLGLQRNLRILGVLTRICLVRGDRHYIDFLPRVWSYVQRNLQHPALTTLTEPLMRSVPAPTPDYCDMLKSKAATCPTP